MVHDYCLSRVELSRVEYVLPTHSVLYVVSLSMSPSVLVSEYCMSPNMVERAFIPEVHSHLVGRAID